MIYVTCHKKWQANTLKYVVVLLVDCLPDSVYQPLQEQVHGFAVWRSVRLAARA